VRPDDQMDRAVPAAGRGAVRAAGCRAGGDERADRREDRDPDGGNRIMSTATDIRYDQAAIEADETVPMIHIWRDFAGTPEQLFRAHTERDLYARWVGPAGQTVVIDRWDASEGGAFRFRGDDSGGAEQSFRGCFHTVRPDRIVQT